MSGRALSMTIITPSYAPDLELCRDLRASLQQCAPGVGHRIIVPHADLAAFAVLARGNATVEDVNSVMPAGFRKVPFLNAWVSLRSPLPPVRGWIAQQIVKLAAVARARTDIALVVDSDVAFLRPFDAATFAPHGRLPLYRIPGAVTPALPRHMIWHRVARQLLGLPPTSSTALPDYICWPCAWSPAVVRAMLERVQGVTGRHWAAAIGRELHFSEMILYGVYVDEVLGADPRDATRDMRCPSHPDEIPLDRSGFDEFLRGVRETDVAVMVSAKSGTALEVRRAALAEFVAAMR
ncbi:DUF6492 family protein [Agromyces ramosus]|uniref:Glycosyltransferase family 2 protein n=1 Tax=Agromyces ramosus TaxID=33879 RepID=A0ABU0R8B3_9MICO|nr:DUF6492 family protein [Agromyces ramosus]MDQ0894278.1 hypothetical protein [Agromyces ramosus]